MVKADEALQNKLIALAKDRKISCTRALQLAKDEAVPATAVRRAADLIGIKITRCKLGCF